MEAANQQAKSTTPPVNRNPADRPAWTVETLQRALRDLESGLAETVERGTRFLQSVGLTKDEAMERAYGWRMKVQRVEPNFGYRAVVELTATFVCLWQDNSDGEIGMDCREAIPFDPDGWCPMCTAR